MQLTAHTDYGLRVLIYLTLHPDRLVTINELAEFFAISKNHLVKVVHNLGLKGFVRTVRGKGGGIRLASPADQISVGSVVRELEGHFQMAECFNPSKQGQCVFQPNCGLTGLLGRAVGQFLQVLDGAKLSDLLSKESLAHGLAGIHSDADEKCRE
ncbi:MAG: Rrf2 family transcriptional regulator [Methylomonas sp.]|jgi:Rrf2 family nitric oxide-sensitive transcriptional repressor|uniref:Rrf2 family transcriptional regulator n=1 Tax=Methylomonas sp. TaxID=418 RepID=UPI0025E1D9C8|nr:Rrf2 family transcriptional regulator [Methylomonas sp.]MCK9607173.1 Rrf2 family transcriptional regulator [Methylomonas sp.]